MSIESRHISKNYSEMRIKGVFDNKQENTDFKQTTKIKFFYCQLMYKRIVFKGVLKFTITLNPLTWKIW